MAKVRDIQFDEIPQDLKSVYQQFCSDYGPFENQVRVIAHCPPALKHIMGLLLELRERAALPRHYLEIALVAVSKLNECEYCVTHHAPMLIREGVDPDTAASILDPECPGLDAVERLVRDYAVQVTQNANRIPSAMHEQLRQHFDESQIVELTLRIALCGFFNRFNDALSIEVENSALLEMMSMAQKMPRHAQSGL